MSLHSVTFGTVSGSSSQLALYSVSKYGSLDKPAPEHFAMYRFCATCDRHFAFLDNAMVAMLIHVVP